MSSAAEPIEVLLVEDRSTFRLELRTGLELERRVRGFRGVPRSPEC
jgi:hypothetical protein